MADDRTHIPEDTLIDYADDPASVADRAGVERHLAACTTCTAMVNTMHLLTSALQDEETWWLTTAIVEAENQQDLAAFVEKMEKENVEAERMLAPLLESQYVFLHANIWRKERFRTGGVVRVLCKRAWAECPNDPQFAHTLAETACAIADALPDDYYPAAAVNELRGSAWKEYSTACRYRGDFPGGFDALNRAKRAYQRLVDGEAQLATVDLCRAALLFEQQCYDEALPLAREAAKVFAERRDMKRYFEAKEWESLIQYRRGDVAAARETYKAAFDMADASNDAEMKARAAKNLGIAYRDEGDLGSSSKYLSIALQLYEGLEQAAMVAHTQWSISNLALAAGNAAEAARRLSAAIAGLEAAGMVNDAARARLDLAEALLQLGEFDEVQSVCATLVTFFRNAAMLTGALTAAAYLKEAAANRSLTVEKIHHVKKYLADVERMPELLFLPPPQ